MARSRNIAASALSAALIAASASAAHAQVPDATITGSIASGAPLLASAGERFPGIETLREAADSYRRGDIAGGDAIAARIGDARMRAAAEWIALRSSGRSLGFERVSRFLAAQPQAPMQVWVQRRAEDAMIIERVRPERVLAFFAKREPESPNGHAALAAALAARGDKARGDKARAAVLALEAYRDKTLTRDVAEFIERQFPDVATTAERALRAHRLILNGATAGGFKLAEALGPDHLKLAQGLASAQGKGESLKALEAVPPAMRGHSSYHLAMAQILRRQDRLDDALTSLVRAPRDAAQLADPDEWWTERRVLTRRLLDKGDHAGAYRAAAEHGGLGPGRRAEAEFHAGWIALRYLAYPQTALMHFEESARHAGLTAARSRAAYWRGRAIDDGATADATSVSAYEAAAGFPTTYYGQLAAERLGREALHLPVTEASPIDESMTRAGFNGGMIEMLLEAGLKEFAAPLAIDFARTAASPTQIDVVADWFVEADDAPTVLAIGRAATARGLPLEQHAFPTFGVPRYQPLPGSEDKAMVYAIARQESAFNARAKSHANARGLMQMLPSTAARTASRFKVAFNADRLIEDPSFNAMLGAAHLGELMEETKGSVVMAFATYNAGGRRVREWVEAFGDPRRPGVDVVDWVERIPFYETRHYVQKIMENMQVYRARFAENRSALLIGEDMERGRRN